jgi:Tol biopolymer transport system component/Zn-dependent M28 family amino/carboxypeptidase
MNKKILLCGLVLGVTASVLEAEDKSNQEEQFLSRVRQLTLEGRRSGEGYFSSDGKNIIFQSERESGNPFYQIYNMSLETGEVNRVSPGSGKTTCAFFRPNTQEVLFASSHADPEALHKQKAELEFRASGKTRRYSWDYDERIDICSASRDGKGVKRLTTALGYDAEGAYSPDGSKIVFCSIRDAYDREDFTDKEKVKFKYDLAYFGEIYIMNADGSDQKRLTFLPGYDGGPFFSPDGKRIIWRHFSEKGDTADVFTMKLDGTDIHRLTEFGSMSWAPYYHPSGEYVAFASNKLGFTNFEVYLVDAAGTREPVRATFTDGFDGLPVFSPDGKQLAWTSNRTENKKSQIFIGKWNHEAALAALGKSKKIKITPLKLPEAQLKVGRSAKFEPAITQKDMRAQVEHLASDDLEGRYTASPGIKKAADYIINQLEALGLEPAGKSKSYRNPMSFKFGVDIIKEKNELVITGKDGKETRFEVGKDFNPLSFTVNNTVDSEVVFGGYGLAVAGKLGEGYDSYNGLDSTNKVVLVLRYVPEKVEEKRKQKLMRSAALQYKATVAGRHGAKGIIIVGGPNSKNSNKLIPVNLDRSAASSGVVAVSGNHRLANAIFAAAGKGDIQSVQDELDKENPHKAFSYPLDGVKIRVTTAVKKVERHDHNVIAVLPPGVKTDKPEYVMIGAHYDHLGYNDGSLQPKGGNPGRIHNGADDNTSGTVTLLELAAWLTEQRKKNPEKFKRGVIFCWWTGEEIGLLGSAQYAKNPLIPFKQVTAYINMDMVGRMKKNQLIMQGIGSSSIWKKLIEKRNVAAGFSLKLQNDPYQPTDITSIYPKGVPSICLFTGLHKDYHKPTDDPDTLNYEDMQRLGQFAGNLTLDLVGDMKRPDYIKVERGNRGGGTRNEMKAYTGVIPDYASEEKGLLINDVRAGGPADKAGIKGGDIVVQFGAKKINNIYDYTEALNDIKIGKAVKVIVMRKKKKVELTITPEARK